MTEPPAILLYDGTCGFCARSVQFVLDRERRRHTLRFASLQGATGIEVRRRHPELSTVDSVIWLEVDSSARERAYVRSAGALRVMRYLGGSWSVLAAIGTIVPRFVRDPIYDLIARHRHELVGEAESCLLPSAEQRARFIDWDSTAGVSG
jgi:predicted DCC family thiol-disulfide oxidoreductase YuxK